MSQQIGKIKEEALKKGVPIIKDEGLAFLLNMIRKRKCRQILELGTAVGYSAIAMAKLHPDIRIDTLEKNEQLYEQALANIAAEGLSEQITVHLTPIEDYVCDRCYDLIFVDAAKAQYKAYLERFLGSLAEDGVMVFDNMVFHGLVFKIGEIRSRSLRSLVRKIAAFREEVQNDERFDIMLFDDIGDGILVLTRRIL